MVSKYHALWKHDKNILIIVTVPQGSGCLDIIMRAADIPEINEEIWLLEGHAIVTVLTPFFIHFVNMLPR